MNGKIVLIDGHSILFRAFHGMPDMTNAEGIHTNAVYGFLRILFRILDAEKPEYLAVAFDTGAPTFRHEKYPDYKGTRQPAPPEFHEQEPIMRQILTDMEIPLLLRKGWEADDILGTLAKRAQAAGMDVTVVTGDHDLLQIADEKIKISIPSNKMGKTEAEDYYAEDVKDIYEVTPQEFIDVKALMGDSSDNIPGLPGVGKVTATKIIAAYGSIENAYENADSITPPKASKALKEHYDLAVLSKDLATIRTDAPVECSFDDCRIGKLYTAAVYEDFKKLGFKSFYSRFDEEMKPKQSEETTADETVTERSAADEIFRQAAEEKTAGIAFAKGKRLYACALYTAGRTFCFPVKEGEEEYYAEKFAALAEQMECVSCCDVKGARKLLGNRDGIPYFDAVIAAYLLNPLKSDYDYDDLANEFLGMTVPSAEELIGKKGIEAACPGQEDRILKMCALSASAAEQSRPALLEKLKEAGMEDLFSQIEMPLTAVLASMETDGILVNPEELKRYGESLSGRIDELTAKIWAAAGEEFNINSPRQMGDILFGKMGLPGGKKTKTGYSTAADVLEKMAEENPIVSDILEYRQLTKLKSTYADGLSAFISEDGRIHTTFNQTITATGRLSSTEPNLQNIPMRVEQGRLIRKCFIPKAGCVFADADYSQIELRILAHMSGDDELIRAYREAKDIHRITASQVFHTPFEEVTEQQRRNAKAVNFGIIYGISSFGLSQGLSISPKEAEKYIRDYFAAYPSIKEFLDGLVASAKEKGYAVSLFGRRRPIPELSSANFMQRGFGERVAMNSPIQGTAADIMKIAMIRVYERLKKEKLKSRLILQIHDELLVETEKEEAEQVTKILEEEMSSAAELKVEIKAECHTGTDWYEAK